MSRSIGWPVMLVVTVTVVASQFLFGTWSRIWRIAVEVPVNHTVLEAPLLNDDEAATEPILNVPKSEATRSGVFRDVLPPAAEEVFPAEPSAKKAEPQRGLPARTIAF